MDFDAILQSAIAEISPEDFSHPGLRKIKFVFCDDKPNANGHGIHRDDFNEIIKSSVGTPIKMKFLGSKVSGHKGSIPIGHINNMFEEEFDGGHRLIAEGTLYQDDYPDEVEYLAHSWAEGQAPGVSFEVSYKESVKESIQDKAVEWLKGVITRAATFVSDPAYGKRTAILAWASDKSISDEDFLAELSVIANDTSPKKTDKGGNYSMEEELKKLREDFDAFKTSQAELVADKDKEIATLTARVDELTTSLSEKETALAEYQVKEVLAARKTTLTEAGITVAIKDERISGMSEEDFTAYVEDLKAVAQSAKAEADNKKKVALASREPVRIPKFDLGEGEKTSVEDLKARFSREGRMSAATE